MKNISKEDYLSVIYKNIDSNREIRATVIAEKLVVSNAAVTDMLKKLAKEALIIYKPYKNIKLTQTGESYAKNMVRRHRIWELFLHQIVGLPWDKVHGEAENLEHSGSDELINRMEVLLNFPEFDPHGDPIPAIDGSIPIQRFSVPLSKLKENESGIVIRVNDFSQNFLAYLAQIGIELKQKIEVKEIRSFDNSMSVQIVGKEFNISQTLADNVYVEIVKN
jgi:DtxR family Mn-dependent transcriptional regulator